MSDKLDEIVIGNIVEIISEDNFHKGKHGRVVKKIKNEKGNIVLDVKLPDYYSLYDEPERSSRILIIGEEEVKKLGRDHIFTSQRKEALDSLFGFSMWHTISLLHMPLMIGFSECMHKGCSNKAITRIMVNSQGVVSEYDVCKEHFHFHGENNPNFKCKKMKVERILDPSKLLDAARFS